MATVSLEMTRRTRFKPLRTGVGSTTSSIAVMIAARQEQEASGITDRGHAAMAALAAPRIVIDVAVASRATKSVCGTVPAQTLLSALAVTMSKGRVAVAMIEVTKDTPWATTGDSEMTMASLFQR